MLDRALVPPGALMPAVAPGPSASSPWVAAAEPSELLRGVALRHVVLDAATGGIAAKLIVRGGALVVDGGCVPGQCDPCPNCPFGGAALRLAAADAPFMGALPVLSALREQLFWVGLPVSTGERAIATYDLDAETTHTVLTNVPLGTMLAATYLRSQARLVALDELERRVGRRTVREVRLSLIAPDTGQLTELGRWPHVLPTTRFILAAAPDGSVYLGASGERSAHAVVRLRVGDDSLRALSYALGPHPLARGAHASSVGVSLVIERSDGRHELIGYRAEHMRAVGRRGFSDCF
jgi:hypothetical protein